MTSSSELAVEVSFMTLMTSSGCFWMSDKVSKNSLQNVALVTFNLFRGKLEWETMKTEYFVVVDVGYSLSEVQGRVWMSLL